MYITYTMLQLLWRFATMLPLCRDASKLFLKIRPPPRHFWQDELYSIRIASNAGIFLSNSTFGLYWLLFVISFYFEFKFSISFPLVNLRKLAGKESLNPLEFHLPSDCPLCTIFTLQTRAVTRYDIHIQGVWHTVHGVYCILQCTVHINNKFR